MGIWMRPDRRAYTRGKNGKPSISSPKSDEYRYPSSSKATPNSGFHMPRGAAYQGPTGKEFSCNQARPSETFRRLSSFVSNRLWIFALLPIFFFCFVLCELLFFL